MNQSLEVELLLIAVRAVNLLIPFVLLALCVWVVRHPREETGFFSWHPLIRLPLLAFLFPIGLLCIILWPYTLFVWYLRRR